MTGMKLIVGLGNPGKEYAGTRHNVGFDVIDGLARRLGVSIGQKKFGSLLGETLVDDCKVLFLKPQTYMNLSGQAVATAAGFYKLPISELIVVADDMALRPGLIRIRPGGGSGGHNGLRDILSRLGTEQFARLRVGIGVSEYPDSRDYVLGRPGREDGELITAAVARSQDALLCWIREGLAAAMNRFNERNNSASATEDNKS
ncbi:MAG: aminoacyl-tRNA hydrolase [Anaerohalosphaeraceae bacterium]